MQKKLLKKKGDFNVQICKELSKFLKKYSYTFVPKFEPSHYKYNAKNWKSLTRSVSVDRPLNQYEVMKDLKKF